MKHITKYKIFESKLTQNEPFDEDQAKLRDDVLDVFMDIKDKWNLEYLPPVNNFYQEHFFEPFAYWYHFVNLNKYEKYMSLWIDFNYDSLPPEDIFQSEKSLKEDIFNLTQRIKKMGYDVEYFSKLIGLFEIRISDHLS